MRTYKIAIPTTSASANNVSSVQIVRNGVIRCIRWAVRCDSITDNSTFVAELSLQPVSQIGTNNTIGPIDELTAAVNFVTSGLMLAALNNTRECALPVSVGENLFINASIAGTITFTGSVFIDIEER
jgi:hypothetical protein